MKKAFTRRGAVWRRPVLSLVALVLLTTACRQRSEERIVAPWGEVNDTTTTGGDFDLDEIQAGGELIVLTLSGPSSYYDYHGRQLGTQYMLAQRFADQLGVRLRVDLCRDTTEMLSKLKRGDADLIAYPLANDSLGWLVGDDKQDLANELHSWFRPSMLADVKQEEAFLLSARSVRRRVYSPMLSRADGIISHYDKLFVQYAQPIRWDWRLLAAQCYQESTFDPQATSWAGACGLMQIMPATADHLGLAREKLYDPESNIAAATKYIAELDASLSDIADRDERTKFVLACYNGGLHHIRDAQALTRRDGGNAHRWSDVSAYVLKLSEPAYYNDPLVKHGYMRGEETVDYVARITGRWREYRGVRSPAMSTPGVHHPQKATHERKRKYQ